MKRGRRISDSTAPSLFPFLAVLLCTMGSLVLILMLIVSAAQNSSSTAIEQARLEHEEQLAQLELAARSYRRQIQERQLDLERRRLALEHLEKHIGELSDELRRIELALRSATEPAPETPNDNADVLSELERQLAEAEEKLENKVPHPDGDKPIYAIIPYQGRNGTHRRPIYLECTEAGLTIQPEGIRLSIEDLQPPHGPGNPLDAALRLIRSEFRPANGALTETAYPLLIVRPDGVRTYALARAAMSGWDDQFGYELVDADLELAFPPSKPGLADKLVQTIAVARQRQMALVLAMPGKYRRGNSIGTMGAGGGTGPAGGAGGGPGGMAGFGRPTADGGVLGEGLAEKGKPFPGPESAGSLMAGSGPIGPNGNHPGAGRLGGEPKANSPLAPAAIHQVDRGGATATTDATFGPAGPITLPSGDLPGTPGSGSFGAPGRTADGAAGGDADRADRLASAAATNGGASGGSGGRSDAYAPPAGGGYPGGSSPGTRSGAAAPGMIRRPTDPGAGETPPGSSPPSLGVQVDGGASTGGSSAEGSGGNRVPRDWTWKQIPPGHTAVVRPIRIHCFADRWIVIPDDGNLDRAVTIPANLPIEQRGMQVATAVDQMVRRWGMAVAGGYWKPVLEVDVAAGAEAQYRVLEALMRRAGLEITARQPSASVPSGPAADPPTPIAQPQSRSVR